MSKDLISKLKKHGLKNSACRLLLHLGSATSNIRKAFFGSYSQYGEDLALDLLTGRKKKGIYVDVGAYDPDELSNTKKFYMKGWSGINIEPNSANFKKFLSGRPRDINLNIGIGSGGGRFDFYLFDAGALCTFSKEEAEKCSKLGYQLKEVIKVEVKRLGEVLSQHPVGRIDFMSVDVEGHDLEVLQSNDWDKFRPRFVCVEVTGHADGVINAKIGEYLGSQGYKSVFFNGLNEIWQDKKDK